MPEARYAEYCTSSDFIRTHIFPGGHLPSMAAMTACATPAGLAAVATTDVGPSYAITLREWRKRWRANWDVIRALGYPETFMRKCALPPMSSSWIGCAPDMATKIDSGVESLRTPSVIPRSYARAGPVLVLRASLMRAQLYHKRAQVGVLLRVLRGRLRLQLHPELPDHVAAHAHSGRAPGPDVFRSTCHRRCAQQREQLCKRIFRRGGGG